uniref:Gag-Pol polyprotein n=1 Tax=Tanacetum cinerariifolium TaxID=118510 RepID=A0A6L2LUR0_TANCI|nr:hypothetical protein [Tanacetum cinerariifolium]
MRYQVNPKISHLHTVKRIFSDYARVSLDRKSTTEGYQFLGSRLKSWQCKKQTVVSKTVLLCLTKRTMFHGHLVFSDDELTEKELKQIEADDQAIQTILLGLPEGIYAAVDSCKTAQGFWLRVQQMMKGSNTGIQEKKAKLFNEWERFTSTDGESIESYYHRFLKLMNDLKRNKYFPEKISSNLKFLNNLQPEWSRHVIIIHQTKDLYTADCTQLYDFLKYNQKEVGNLNGYNDVQNVKNQVILNAVQNPIIQNVGNQNGLIVVPGNANQNPNENGNLVVASSEGNATGHNGIQFQAEEFDLMAAVAYLDEIEEVNANCILMANM